VSDAIRYENVTVKRDKLTVLERVTASVPHGSVTAIIGPNGAGKTTLLLATLRLIRYSGTIALARRSGPGAPRIGYVPQRIDFDRGAPITVLDFLTMGVQRRPVWFGVSPSIRERCRESLRRVGAAELIHRPLGKLSGGELQRVQLALALDGEPEIVLLDEPVSGVDIVGERLFCDMLEQLQCESRFTMVMVSHDLSVVSRHATHVICLNQRVQCAGPTPEVLSAENLAAIYGPHMGLYDHHALPAGACGTHHHHHHDHEKPAASGKDA
jgi:zinc transport system ATP-binding protein